MLEWGIPEREEYAQKLSALICIESVLIVKVAAMDLPGFNLEKLVECGILGL